jgi:hypothetical protein
MHINTEEYKSLFLFFFSFFLFFFSFLHGLVIVFSYDTWERERVWRDTFFTFDHASFE